MTTYKNGIVAPSEHNEQSSFFDWLTVFKLREFPEIHPLFFAVPNGAHLAGDVRQRAAKMNMMKKEGFTPGVADTVFLSGRGGYLGLVMEFKTEERKVEKNGGLSENQLEFLNSARMEGLQATCAYGAEDAIDITCKYLAMPRTQDMIYSALRSAEKGDLEGCKKILQEVTLRW